MNGDRFLVDTNAIIFHLSGNKNVEAVLDNSIIYISSITFAELLSGKLNNKETIVLHKYLKAVHVVHTNDFICETAATFRKNFKIKLPDALSAATGLFLDVPLISFDNDFDKIDDLKIIKLTL